MSRDSVTVAEIKAGLIGRCPGLLRDLVPGLRREGNVYGAPNPTRPGKKNGSFKVWPTGNFRAYDESEDTGKGDILGLIAYLGGHHPRTREGRRYALQWARRELGLDTRDPERAAVVKRQAQAASQAAAEAEEKRAGFKRRRVVEIRAGCLTLASPQASIVHRYLAGCGLDWRAIAQPTVGALGVHPRLTHWAMPEGKVWSGPAMVATIQTPGGPAGLHATFLAEDARGVTKAPVPKPKLMLGEVKGGVAPLSLGPRGRTISECAAAGEPEDVILCEGIETGLALAMAIPEARVWACLSLGNIGHAPVGHAGVRAIIVALENDLKPAALAARAEMLDALARWGKPVSTMASHVGSDFADLMKEGM